jgi:hypothetical protein
MNLARPLALAIAVCVTAPVSPAQAQMGGLGGPVTVETEQKTALGRLPRPLVDWVTEESIRQAQSPGDLGTLDAEMEEAMGGPLETGARRTRMEVADLVSAMRYHIVREAGRLLDEDIRARKALAGDDPSDEEMLNIETAISHRNRIRALEDQAKRRLTRKAAAFVD